MLLPAAGLTGLVEINSNGDRNRVLTLWAIEPGSVQYSTYLDIDLVHSAVRNLLFSD